MSDTIQTATYKFRKYNLLYIGQTKYGRRANLEFTDGSKSFWCDAALVTVHPVEVAEPAPEPVEYEDDEDEWNDAEYTSEDYYEFA